MINIDNSLEAVIQSGLAESAASAHQNGWELFAISAPLDGVPMRLPTSADAGGWPHYFPGGHTAIRVDDEWVINPTREFVIDGGIPMPPGTMVFRMVEGKGWEIFATFK